MTEMLSDNTSYRVCEILTSSDSSPLINFASGLSAILDGGFIWDPVLLVFSATRDLTMTTDMMLSRAVSRKI